MYALVEEKLDKKVSELKGAKGFIVKKIWPVVKVFIIDMVIDLLLKEKSKS